MAITGESGSGKTTLLRILGGLETYDDGELYIDGEPTFRYDATDWENYRREKVGYVFQDYSLIGSYSALYNLAVYALTVAAFNRYLRKWMKNQELRMWFILNCFGVDTRLLWANRAMRR